MSNDQISAALNKPFPAADIKPHPNDRNLKYIEGHTVIKRLNEATDNRWDFRIITQDMRPFGKTSKGADRLIITAVVELIIPNLGARQHMGVQVVNAESGGEDMWKGAITDGLKKCATLFGVALELYEDAPVARSQPRTAQSPAKAADDAAITDQALQALSARATKAGITGEDLAALIQWSYGAELLSDLTIAQGREVYSTLDKSNAAELRELVRTARAALDTASATSTQAMMADFNTRHPADFTR